MHKSAIRPTLILNWGCSEERFSRLDVFGFVPAAPAHGTLTRWPQRPPTLGPFYVVESPRDTTGPETSAFPLMLRFNAACPPSPVADIPNGQIAGTSTTAISVSGRSRGASATRLILTPGSGLADSIPAVTLASVRATPPKRLTRPVASSKRHAQCSYRNGPRPTFRSGAINGIGRLRNIVASIEASACRRTGSRSARLADKISARL